MIACSELFKPPEPPYEKFSQEPLKSSTMPPEKKKLNNGIPWTYMKDGWTYTVPMINSEGILTDSSNTYSPLDLNCDYTEPIDSLPLSPIVSTNSDSLKEIVSCTTPSAKTEKENSSFVKSTRPKEAVMKPEESMTPVEPKRKSTVKSWFKSLTSLFKSPVTGSTVESPVEIFEASENNSLSSQIIEPSDSELELPLEKVTSFRKVEKLDASEVEESDTELPLPPFMYQKMKGKIITEFLANRGSQKQSRSQKKKGRKSKNSQMQSSQQKQPCQSLPANISNRAKEQIAESPTNISKNVSKGKVCSNTMRPVGRFKDDMSSDTVSRDEDSEHNKDSDDSEQEINSSETETVESLTKLLDNPSLTSAQRQNLCSKIAWKRGVNELNRRRNEAAVLGQLR